MAMSADTPPVNMASNPNKVLVVIVGDYCTTGVVSYLNNHLPLLVDTCNCKVTLFAPGVIVDKEGAESLRSKGITILAGGIPSSSSVVKKQKALLHALDILLDTEHFDAIHINTANRPVAYEALRCATKHGVPTRIAHSHSAGITHSLPVQIAALWYRTRINQLATDYLACTNQAGTFLFGNETWSESGQVAINGIDCSRYRYSEATRDQVRSLYIDDSTTRVHGLVGRLSQEKNPLFAIDVFEKLITKNQNSMLWVIGDGPLLPAIEKAIKDKGLQEKVITFGVRHDVDRLLQGMDALLMPSLREGLPMSLIEAQTAGLPCFVSDAIPESACIEGCDVTRFAKSASAVVWANRIAQSDLSRNTQGFDAVVAAGYDITSSVEVLAPYYCGINNDWE